MIGEQRSVRAFLEAEELVREEIKNLLYLLIDVVVQFGVEHRERCIKEVWYDPARKRRSLAASSH